MMTLNNRVGFKDVVTLPPSALACEAARAMRDYNVGCAVIVESQGRAVRPIGILTDRDVVVRAVAAGADPAEVKVESLMSKPVIAAHLGESEAQILNKMHAHGIRRMPLLDESGNLASIITLDDLWVSPRGAASARCR